MQTGQEGIQEWGLGRLGVPCFNMALGGGHGEGQPQDEETELRVCRELEAHQPHWIMWPLLGPEVIILKRNPL